MFDELVFNYALLDSTYPEYVYHKRFVLGPEHPNGLHNDMHGGYGKIEYDDAMEAIRFVESIKSYLRLFIWLPLKLYFYTCAVRFAKLLKQNVD